MGRLSKRIREKLQADKQPVTYDNQPAPETQLRQHRNKIKNVTDDGSIEKTYENIVTQESKMPLGELYDIKRDPVPKSVCEEEIYGVPMDWHDLENFVIKLSPTNYVTMLKLRDQDKADYDKRFKVRKSMMSGKIIILILVAVGLAIGGVIMLMFMPEILAFFQQGAGGV